MRVINRVHAILGPTPAGSAGKRNAICCEIVKVVPGNARNILVGKPTRGDKVPLGHFFGPFECQHVVMRCVTINKKKGLVS